MLLLVYRLVLQCVQNGGGGGAAFKQLILVKHLASLFQKLMHQIPALIQYKLIFYFDLKKNSMTRELLVVAITQRTKQ